MGNTTYDNLPCLCLNKNYTTTIETPDFKIIKCTNCGLHRTIPLPDSSKDRYHDYNIDSYLKNKKILMPFINDIIREIIKIKPRGKLLDIGCSVGYLLEVAKNKGFTISGVEPCAAGAAKANEILGYSTVKECLLDEALYQNDYFDIIILNHTIEHILDLAGIFKEIKKIIKKDGIIVIGIPNFGSPFAKLVGKRWTGLQHKEHIWQFDPAGLKKFLSSQGFEIVKIRKTSSYKFHQIKSKYSFANWIFGFLGGGDNLILCLRIK